MTNTAVASVSVSSPAPTPPPAGGGLVRGLDSALDASVVALATWTLVYHLCLVLRLGVPWAVSLEVAALAVVCGLWLLLTRRSRSEQPSQVHPEILTGTTGTRHRSRFSSWRNRALVCVAAGTAAVAAVAMAVTAPWPLVATAWIASAGTGTAWALLDLRDADTAAGTWPGDEAKAPIVPPDSERHGAIIALTWAIVLGASTLFWLRPNPDDVYYVNLSQWVAEHGTFPLRDTIFANLVFPMSSWPPMASYDALVGTIARLAGVHAAFVVYVVAPPFVAVLSVLALWRLLRAWQVKSIALALSTAMAVLLLDGGSLHAVGNLFLNRLWQGKIVFLCLMVPLLLVYALRYVETPTRARAGWLFVGGVAAVGITTSAMFLTPMIAIAGAAPLLVRSPRRALTGFAAMAAYPLGAGAVTKALGGRSADNFLGGQQRFDPAQFGHEVFYNGVMAVIVVGAVLFGVLLVPHRLARVTTGLLALFVGITYIPGFTHLSFTVIGLGPTLWRVSWLVTAAALVGVAASRISERWSHPALRASGPLAVVALMIVFSQPIWDGATSTVLDAPFHYQQQPTSTAMASRVIKGAAPGDLVLAPQTLSLTITILTTHIHSVDPRAYFMNYLHSNPAFDYDKRVTLSNFVDDSGPWHGAKVVKDLHALGVDVVCLQPARTADVRTVVKAGYHPAYRSTSYVCLTR